jgi:hypothetical protein
VKQYKNTENWRWATTEHINNRGLSILIYEFSPFNYTLVCYKNVETLLTDRVRNVVMTKSPDKDMIVRFARIDATFICRKVIYHQHIFSWQLIVHVWFFEYHIKDTEGFPSASQLRNKSGIYACKAYNIITGQMYTTTKTVNFILGEYMPWLNLN